MTPIQEKLANLGVKIPEVLLPAPDVDPQAWAVVACDQYSSEKDYWERVAAFVKGKPSTLDLIFPECYLEDNDKNERIGRIRESMDSFLARKLLASPGEGFILVERSTPYEEKPRLGLVIAVDLERYRYGKDSKSLIRPTEGTIVERLPPRMAIRRQAGLELPHIMVLVDDPGRTLVEPIHSRRSYLKKLYDFDLMEGSGHLRGWFVNNPAMLDGFAAALETLADPAAFRARYGTDDLLLFAVGDGNHSLATAKAVWEEIKASRGGDSAELLATHPARHALVELLNVYDEGLPFHPIHRVLFNVDRKAFLAALREAGAELSHRPGSAEAFAVCDEADPEGAHRIAWVDELGAGLARFPHPESRLAAGTIQGLLDRYRAAHPSTGIDYIHGTGSLETLGAKPGNIGLYLPPVDKASFFGTVIRDGVMPRKTFSMGEAPEKRFYMEARRIRP